MKHCRELGIDGDSAARLLMFFGIASFSARLLIGRLGDCKCVSSLHLIQVGSLGVAITILLLPLARAYRAFVVFSIVDGFLDGLMGSQFNLVLLTTVSPQLRATAFGYANCLASLTLTIGPSIAGQYYIASHVGVFRGGRLSSLPPGGGGTRRKIGQRCAARFPKPLPYL